MNPGEFTVSALGVIVCYPLGIRKLAWHPQRRVTKYLQGPYMRNAELALHEFGAAFQYPYGTGLNWDALDDWMRDEYWFGPGEEYLIVIYEAELLLIDDPSGFAIFIESIDALWADYWKSESVPPVRFRVLLQVDPSVAGVLLSRLESANAVWQEVSE
jgi:Barstar (barnase inhibitor)